MAAVSIRNLDEDVKQKLRLRAAQHGRSMESEIRAILAEAVMPPSPPAGLFGTILQRFTELGGTELDLPERSITPRGPALG